jgi:hypothetical protein
MNPIEEIDYKNYKINISYDEYSDDPSEWGNFTITEGVQDLTNDLDEFTKETKKKMQAGKLFLVDKFEHSSVAYYLSGENVDKWDTYHGWGYIEFGDEYAANFDTLEGRREMARQDLATYTQWANGDVYAVYIYDQNGENIDGCGGIYADTIEELIEQAKDTIDNLPTIHDAAYAKNAGALHV